MKILNFSSIDLNQLNEKKILNKVEFFNNILERKFDVLVIDYIYYNDLVEVVNYFSGKIIFITDSYNNIIYEKALKIGDYCFNYNEIDLILIRLDYIKKTIHNSPIFKYKDLTFNIDTKQLLKKEKFISLTIAETELLSVLIKYKNIFINNLLILEECCYINNIDSIRVFIFKLRKIGFEIRNKKHVGYKISFKR